MNKNRVLISTLIAALFVVQPALAQNKAATAKLATEFQQQSVALATTLAALSKRVATASPNDKEMLKLVNNQLGLVDATADGVLALGFVAAEVRDGGAQTVTKKYLSTRCAALKTLADTTATYIGSLANNIAAPASAAEVNKAKELVAQIGQSTLCASVGR
jgi:hypothetical protein